MNTMWKYNGTQWVLRLLDGWKMKKINENLSSSRSLLVKDRYDNKVFLFENDFALRWFQDKNPDIKLSNPMDAEINNKKLVILNKE